MYVAYCKKCNHFSYLTRISNYCRECKKPIIRLDISVEEFANMSLKERYKLAYKLTNEENNKYRRD